MTMIDQLKELEKKAEKYDDLAKEHSALRDSLGAIRDDIDQLIKNHGIPTIKILLGNGTHGRRRGISQERINTLLEMVRGGEILTTLKIEEKLQIPHGNSYYYFKQLKDNPNVKFRKNGALGELYWNPSGIGIHLKPNVILKEKIKHEKLGEWKFPENKGEKNE